MSELKYNCKRSDCGIATTGKCVEGLDVDVCPNLLRIEDESRETSSVLEDVLSVDTAASDSAEMVELPLGTDFDLISARQITRAHLTRVIVVAGPKDCGKTTLITSVYERFQEGPFAGYAFAGSATLPGFERRCFPSRIASENIKPDTVRTTRGDGQKLLHLRLQDEQPPKRNHDLLLADISGEFFRDACDSDDGCKQLQILKRADHVAIALDGKKLADRAFRDEVFHSAVLLLRSALTTGMVGKSTLLEILVTKRDQLALGAEDTLSRLERFRQKLNAEFSTEFAKFDFFEVAARPDGVEFPLAYGLDDVLRSWVETTPLFTKRTIVDLEAFGSHSARTQFDKFLTRRRLIRLL